MEIVGTIIEDCIVIIYENEEGTQESFRYDLNGRLFDEHEETHVPEYAPDWLIKHANTMGLNNHVVFTHIVKWDEDDFREIMKKIKRARGPRLNRLVKGAIFTKEHEKHIMDYMSDFDWEK